MIDVLGDLAEFAKRAQGILTVAAAVGTAVSAGVLYFISNRVKGIKKQVERNEDKGVAKDLRDATKDLSDFDRRTRSEANADTMRGAVDGLVRDMHGLMDLIATGAGNDLQTREDIASIRQRTDENSVEIDEVMAGLATLRGEIKAVLSLPPRVELLEKKMEDVEAFLSKPPYGYASRHTLRPGA